MDGKCEEKQPAALKIAFYAAMTFFFANFNLTVFGGMFNLYGHLGVLKYFSMPGLAGIFLICALLGIPGASFTMLAVFLARRLNTGLISFFIFAMLLSGAGAMVFFLLAGSDPRIAIFFAFSEAIIAASCGIGLAIAQKSEGKKRQFWAHYILTLLSLPFIIGTFYGYAYLAEIASHKYRHFDSQKMVNDPIVSPYWEAVKIDAAKWFSFKSFDSLFAGADKCIFKRWPDKTNKLIVGNSKGWSCIYGFYQDKPYKINERSVFYIHKGIFESGKGELISAKFSPDGKGSYSVNATITTFDGKGWRKENIRGARRVISGAEALNAVEAHERNRTENILRPPLR